MHDTPSPVPPDLSARMRAILLAPGQRDLRRSSVLSVLAGLIWPVQAACIAWALAGLLAGDAPAPLLAAALFAGAGTLRATVGYRAETYAQRAADAIIHTARADMVAKLGTRVDDSGMGGAGALAALAAEKLDLLGPFLTRYAPARARAAVLPLVILALAFWYSWAVGLVLLVAGPLIPVFMALIGLAAKEASARQMVEIGTLNDFLVERMTALPDIRLLGAGARVEADLASHATDLRERTMAVLRVAFLSSTVLELFAAIGVAMVAVYVGFSLLGQLGFGAWGGPLAPAAGIFLLLLAPEFFQPLRDLSAAWHDKAAADAVIDELTRFRAETNIPLLGEGARAQPLPGPASVELRGCVTPAGQKLPDITVAAGERVALVGPSGAGKTSALRLMAGLADPGTGSVQVAGQALTSATADAWRARLGWMPQGVHFTTGSLRWNVTFGRDGDLADSLRAAAIDRVVAGLAKGPGTPLGETGGGLSGGEARRITLARALHGHPDMILADEPTADLDQATAATVTDALLAQATRGTTLIVATHDPALMARMDRVIMLGTPG